MNEIDTATSLDLPQEAAPLSQPLAVRSEAPAPVIQEGSGSLMAAIVAMAKDPDVNVDKLQAILTMQEHMEERAEQRERLAAFNRDFHAMSKRLPVIKRDGTIEYAEDKKKPDGAKIKIASYAKWETIMAAIKPILEEFGFNLSWDTAQRAGDGGGLICIGTLRHQAGHQITASIPLPLDSSGGKNNLQGYGSTTSYGQRYTSKMLLNIVYEGEDDDGKRGGMQFVGDKEIAEIRAMFPDAGIATPEQEFRFLEAIGHTHIGNIEMGEMTIVKNILAGRAAGRKQKAAP